MLGRDSAVWAAGLKRDSYPGADRLEAGPRRVGKDLYRAHWIRAAHWPACGGRSKFGESRLGSEPRTGSCRVQDPHRVLTSSVYTNHRCSTCDNLLSIWFVPWADLLPQHHRLRHLCERERLLRRDQRDHFRDIYASPPTCAVTRIAAHRCSTKASLYHAR